MRRCKAGWFKTYLELTRSMESPLLYHVWSAVAVISAAMSRNCCFDMRRWKVYPNMYVVLIGPTGIAKSTASRHAVKLLRKAFPDPAKNLIIEGKLTGPRLCLDMNAAYLATGQSKVFIHAPEFTVFTDSTMKDDTLLKDMMNYWDCPDQYEYRLKTGGITTVDNVYVSLLGCSTPELLENAGKTEFIDSGFSARIIYVPVLKNERRVYRPELNPDAQKLEEDLIHDLQEIGKLALQYDWDDSGDQWMKTWYENEDWRMVSDKRMLGYIERKQTHLIKLTMIIKAGLGDDPIITAKENAYALEMLDRLEPGQAKIYQTIGSSKYAQLVQKIIDILSHHSDWVSESVLYKHLGKKTPKKDILTALETLESGGVIEAEVGHSGFGGGRLTQRYRIKAEPSKEHHYGQETVLNRE